MNVFPFANYFDYGNIMGTIDNYIERGDYAYITTLGHDSGTMGHSGSMPPGNILMMTLYCSNESKCVNLVNALKNTPTMVLHEGLGCRPHIVMGMLHLPFNVKVLMPGPGGKTVKFMTVISDKDHNGSGAIVPPQQQQQHYPLCINPHQLCNVETNLPTPITTDPANDVGYDIPDKDWQVAHCLQSGATGVGAGAYDNRKSYCERPNICGCHVNEVDQPYHGRHRHQTFDDKQGPVLETESVNADRSDCQEESQACRQHGRKSVTDAPAVVLQQPPQLDYPVPSPLSHRCSLQCEAVAGLWMV